MQVEGFRQILYVIRPKIKLRKFLEFKRFQNSNPCTSTNAQLVSHSRIRLLPHSTEQQQYITIQQDKITSMWKSASHHPLPGLMPGKGASKFHYMVRSTLLHLCLLVTPSGKIEAFTKCMVS